MTTTNAPPGIGNPKLSMAKIQNVSCASGQELVLFQGNGPGEVDSLWMALGGGNHPALDGRLRVYYDASPTPAFDLDLGTLLAMHYGAIGNHRTAHCAAQIGGSFGPYSLGFLLTYPMPYGPNGIKVAYYNPAGTGQTAQVYSQVMHHLTDTDSCQRLRGAGTRVLDTQASRAAGDASGILATDSGGPGSVVHLGYVGGVGATNFTWLERPFAFLIDGEASPSISTTGTEDSFDSAWYYEGNHDFDASLHSYVGVDGNPGFTPPEPYVVGMLTDWLSKWGGVPFTSSFTLEWQAKGNETTGDSFTSACLWYR